MKELQGRASSAVSASAEDSYALLADLEGYPGWHPDVVRRVQVVERDEERRARRARATLHLAYGPLARDFELLLDVRVAPPHTVELERVPHGRSDPERFAVKWRIEAGTTIELLLTAQLSVPRLLPVGGIGDELAGGFVAAAKRALES